MPCQCDIDIQSRLDSNASLEAIKEVFIEIINDLHSYCCFGISSVSPIIDIEASNSQAFPNGFGSLECECPISYMYDDSDSIFYYSIDEGTSWSPISTANDCVGYFIIDNEFDHPNFQDNTGFQDILLSQNNNCLLIFASDENGEIWKVQQDQEIGDGSVDGEWCKTCVRDVQDLIEIFEFTGDVQLATCPPLANRVEIKAWGGGGGNDLNESGFGATNFYGGSGGYTHAIFNVREKEIFSGDQLTVYVGGAGDDAYEDTGTSLGGYPYGGDSRQRNDNRDGGAGGGLSAVSIGAIVPTDFSNALVVAGGGGGANYYDNGHNGNDENDCGGLSSAQGWSGTPSDTAGAGGGGGAFGGNNFPISNRYSGRGGCGHVDAQALSSEIGNGVYTGSSPAEIPSDDDDDYIKYAPTDAGGSSENGFVLVRWFFE